MKTAVFIALFMLERNCLCIRHIGRSWNICEVGSKGIQWSAL